MKNEIYINKSHTVQFIDFLKENSCLKDSVNLRIRLKNCENSLLLIIYAIEQESIIKNPYSIDRYYKGEFFQYFNLGECISDISNLEDVLILIPKSHLVELDSIHLTSDYDLKLEFWEDEKNDFMPMLNWYYLNKENEFELVEKGPIQLVEISCKLIDDIAFRVSNNKDSIGFYSTDELYKNLLSVKSNFSPKHNMEDQDDYKDKNYNKKDNDSLAIYLLAGENKICQVLNMTIFDVNVPIRDVKIHVDNNKMDQFIDIKLEKLSSKLNILFSKQLLYKNSINALLAFLKPRVSKGFEFYYKLSLIRFKLGSFLVFEHLFVNCNEEDFNAIRARYLLFMLPN